MATDVTLPELGENITRATVLDVLVAAGDEVTKDQALLTLESDKAEFDLPSPQAGKIAEILVAKGDEIEVGQVIVRLDAAAGGGEAAPKKEAAPAAEKKAAEPAPKKAQAAKPAAPKEQDEDTEAQQAAQPAAKQDGAARSGAAGQKSAPLQKSAPKKAAVDDEEAAEPAEPQEEAAPQKPAPHAAAPQAATGGAQQPSSDAARVAAAPSVRRLARELGVDIAEVARSSAGKDRVEAEDIYRYVRGRLAGSKDGGGEGAGRDYSRWGETEVIAMTTVRRKTAERMSLAWSSIPHVTHHDLADITDLEKLRKQFAPRVERSGGKLTITAILLKVLGSALRRHPKFNASVDMENAAVIEKHFVNVGVAVDTERGLLVPVIQRCDEKNIVELALELRDLSEGARNRKLRPDQLQGATFTVTNLGGIGGTHFSPLINPPEVAVLGVSRTDVRQVWVEGKFEPRQMLPLSLSYDHRIIDGADAARFLRWVCEALAEPFLMDLEGE